MKRTSLLVVLIVGLLMPQLAFAAWWNPFSWFRKADQIQGFESRTRIETAATIDVVTSTTTEESLIEAKVKERVEAALKEKEEEQKRIQAAAKAKADEQKRIDTAVKAALEEQTRKNAEEKAKQEVMTPKVGQTYPVPQVRGEDNYYTDLKIDLKSLIQIEKSYRAWLDDIASQLRSMVITLSGYNVGGLYGKSRDAAIDLANSQIKVITSLTQDNDKIIVNYEALLDYLNVHPNEFVDQTAYQKIKSPGDAQAYINSIESEISKVVQSVANALKYH
jgi:hypothetical protein